MRVIVLGGTRFVGRALVDELVGAGHDVLVVHRGEHEPADGAVASVGHLHVDRRRLAGSRRALAAFAPDGVVDLSAMTGADTIAVLDVVASLDPAPRVVTASSMDVYRAYAALWAGEIRDAVPLDEDAPLRAGPPPDLTARAPAGWDLDMRAYDKVDVERAVLARGGVVCRLPFVYGAHDYQRREEFVLRRVRAGRRRMPIGPGAWLGSRGEVGELARGLRLALEVAPGATVLNLCETSCAPMRLWAEQIVAAAGADLELVEVPAAVLPPDLALTGALGQHLLVDPSRAERVLGWVHAPAATTVPRSVAWHLAHPPEGDPEPFDADERALP